jgi:choline dehydrogenase-like flavoprotein
MAAKGVEFHFDKKKFQVKATREVILSAGSFESPKLLMLSGIGPAEQLAQHGIKVIKDLPVGETLYEHLGVLGPLVIINNIDNLISMDSLLNPKSLFEWLSGKGPLTSNSVETLTYMRTNYSMFPDEDIPDIEVMQAFSDVSYDTSPGTRKAFRLTDEVYDAVYKPLEKLRAFQFLLLLLHPRSKGHMRLKSKNPYHYPLFYPNYFDDERDLDTFVAGIREVIRIIQQKPFQDIGARLHEAKVPGCEGLEFNSDEYWRCYSMHMTITYHHQVSIAK